MRRILRSICSRGLIDAITGAGKLGLQRHARALAVMLVIALLVTSLPASAGTSSRAYAATRQQRSFVSQLYSDLGTTLVSFALVGGILRFSNPAEAPSYRPFGLTGSWS